ncbi:hypothetical protein PR048_000450 [Dryococelus australis]|uniref:Uncharacterized protein n=1 Tax=Dryococelus australis TaxID=614101 RepID=A0ABQ9IEM7_9NEOP|nr:hypothetical protein PR048_000450 [Dryococelus australis]
MTRGGGSDQQKGNLRLRVSSSEGPIVQPASHTLPCLILAVAEFPSADHFSRCSSSIARSSATHSLINYSSTPVPEACHDIYTVRPDHLEGSVHLESLSPTWWLQNYHRATHRFCKVKREQQPIKADPKDEDAPYTIAALECSKTRPPLTKDDPLLQLLLASHLDEPASIPDWVTPGFSHVGIALDDTVGRQVFLGDLPFPRSCIPALLRTHLTSPTSALKTWINRVLDGSAGPFTDTAANHKSKPRDIYMPNWRKCWSFGTAYLRCDGGVCLTSSTPHVRWAGLLVCKCGRRGSAAARENLNCLPLLVRRLDHVTPARTTRVPFQDFRISTDYLHNNHFRKTPDKANRIQSPIGSPDFRMWESCRTMPLVSGFSRRGSHFAPALAFRRWSILTSLHPQQPSRPREGEREFPRLLQTAAEDGIDKKKLQTICCVGGVQVEGRAKPAQSKRHKRERKHVPPDGGENSAHRSPDVEGCYLFAHSQGKSTHRMLWKRLGRGTGRMRKNEKGGEECETHYSFHFNYTEGQGCVQNGRRLGCPIPRNVFNGCLYRSLVSGRNTFDFSRSHSGYWFLLRAPSVYTTEHEPAYLATLHHMPLQASIL